jgi:hypothetical protein
MSATTCSSWKQKKSDPIPVPRSLQGVLRRRRPKHAIVRGVRMIACVHRDGTVHALTVRRCHTHQWTVVGGRELAECREKCLRVRKEDVRTPLDLSESAFRNFRDALEDALRGLPKVCFQT